MDKKRWERINELFLAALDRDKNERAAFLDEACSDDPSLRAEVESLLAIDSKADGFLETPESITGSSDEPDGKLVGKRVGKYRLQRIISSGGMGTVYEALQEQPRRTVAVKVIKEGIVSKEILRRFEYESQILARLRHSGIAQVFEAGTHGEVPYFVMEYIPNAKSITEYARVKKLSVKERLALFTQACEAVHHGHQKGIIHRDLKPANILVDAEGTVKVIDFGVARATDSDLALTTIGTDVGKLIGTLQYMSPEQCKADPHDLDTRSDVYALGMVLYELLCDELPYDVKKVAVFEATRIIREEPPKKPSTINRTLRGDAETIVLKALEKNRKFRYQAVADFNEDLKRFLEGNVIMAKPAGLGIRFWKQVKRNPVVSAAVGVAILAAICLVGYILFVSYPQIRAEQAKTASALKGEVAARKEAEAEKERALAAEEKEANQRRIAEERYNEITRLSDIKRLSDLEREAEKLWPAYPETVAALKSWLERADLLIKRLDVHRATLKGLRDAALPYDEEDARRDKESYPKWPDLQAMRDSKEKLLVRIKGIKVSAKGSESSSEDTDEEKASAEDLDALREQLAALESQIADLDHEVSVRRIFDFKDLETQWQHNMLAGLVSGLEALADIKTGLYADVRDRLAFAETIEEKSIDAHRDAWDEAIASIQDEAKCPQYKSLVIEPKIGCVPIGRDPDSGLWEFAHLQTGEIPKRGPDGKLILTEEMGLVFVLIPGGSFMMGAIKPDEKHPKGSPNVDPEARVAEGPVHEVALDPYLMSKYEMTQGQWLRFTGRNPSSFGPGGKYVVKVGGLLHPVENVSWEDCSKVLSKLKLRFPSESEWEYACRAGTGTVFFTGDDKKTLQGAANLFCKNDDGSGWPSPYEDWQDGYTVHAPVGSFSANAFGLHDVHGNVNEWCQDMYWRYENTPMNGTTNKRVYRGGSWKDLAFFCRSACRQWYDPGFHYSGFGLRPALSCH